MRGFERGGVRVMWVKICGITRLEDAVSAARFGADAVGFIFADSPRRVPEDVARDISMRMPAGPAKVGVFADAPFDEVKRVAGRLGLDMVQLHGDEGPEYCDALGDAAIKAVKVSGGLDVLEVNRYRCGLVLVEARNGRRGGHGGGFDWRVLRMPHLRKSLVVAGGLSPENVAGVVKAARPYGVDVASGVESAPGVKDPVLMYRFIENARRADYEVRAC